MLAQYLCPFQAAGPSELANISALRARGGVCCCKKNRWCGFLGQPTVSGSSGVLNSVSFVRTKPVELSLGKLPLKVCCAVLLQRSVQRRHAAFGN